MKQPKYKDITGLYDYRISKTQLDDLLNSAVTSIFIHTSYNSSDVELFKKQLFKFVEQENFVDITEVNNFIKGISVRATQNSFTQIDFYKNNGTFSERQLKPLSLNNKEISTITDKTTAVINSFIADIGKAKAFDSFVKADFITRATTIAQCETARITNLSAEKVATKEGFTSWIWGGSGSTTPREEHEVITGVESNIGETPAVDGEYPGELPNCACTMIFVKGSSNDEGEE